MGNPSWYTIKTWQVKKALAREKRPFKVSVHVQKPIDITEDLIYDSRNTPRMGIVIDELKELHE